MITRSRITSQGQISVPLEVRKKLGVGPGAVIEWAEDDEGRITVRRAGRYTSHDIHLAIFGNRKPKPQSLRQLKEGIRQYIRKRHARY
ncbi:MAG TPA: AbrB/MazE/SpoVT family DNA-binding domain-containing protein [Bryobacteraceae bacterium]|nr:AbrB/MazE/SpoVT family DNA-binding domain-containing protein [Bryobacteraceae bacterium]